MRASAAEALRSILAADPAAAPNWHSEAFWKQRIAELKGGMPLDEALKMLLPELSPAEREKTRTTSFDTGGRSGFNSYQLDDYWSVGLYLLDGKLRDYGPNLAQVGVRSMPSCLPNIRAIG